MLRDEGLLSCSAGRSLLGCSAGGRRDAVFPDPDAAFAVFYKKDAGLSLPIHLVGLPSGCKAADFFPVPGRN